MTNAALHTRSERKKISLSSGCFIRENNMLCWHVLDTTAK